jgi:hypothetical protein
MFGIVPAIGTCTSCNREFKVSITAMKRVADAQENLRVPLRCVNPTLNIYPDTAALFLKPGHLAY